MSNRRKLGIVREAKRKHRKEYGNALALVAAEIKQYGEKEAWRRIMERRNAHG